MAASHSEVWNKRVESERQRLIRDFVASNDLTLRDDFLGQVRAPQGYGLFASTGPNYQYAVFGRDSIEAAEDVLAVYPDIAKEIIFTCAHFQGQAYTHTNEEEPGKIHHEYRSRRWGGELAPHAAQVVFEQLSRQWGGNDDEMRYYGSYDASVLFVRLVHRYCAMYGDAILSQKVIGYTQSQQTLRHHVRKAALWFCGRITASPWQLFEYKRLNPAGIYHQAWQDSERAYLHTDGNNAIAETGIASAELQAYAYDALLAAADIAAASDDEATAWRELAASLQANTLQRLWMHDEQFFAMGLDRAPDGNTRHIATRSSNAGLLLDSLLLHHVAEDQRWPYIEHTVRALFSDDFLTAAGIRVRARRHKDLVDFADYHGAEVSWPKQTYDIAKGLRNHGFIALASLLEACILHSVTQAGEFYEFFFVHSDGKVKYHYRHEHPEEPTFHEFGAANVPEPGQAWTISAVLAIVALQHQTNVPPTPLTDLEREILQSDHVQAIATRVGFSMATYFGQ